MPVLASVWPALSMGGNTAPKDNKARLLNVLNDTRNLLDYISKYANHRTPPWLYEYLK